MMIKSSHRHSSCRCYFFYCDIIKTFFPKQHRCGFVYSLLCILGLKFTFCYFLVHKNSFYPKIKFFNSARADERGSPKPGGMRAAFQNAPIGLFERPEARVGLRRRHLPVGQRWTGRLSLSRRASAEAPSPLPSDYNPTCGKREGVPRLVRVLPSPLPEGPGTRERLPRNPGRRGRRRPFPALSPRGIAASTARHPSRSTGTDANEDGPALGERGPISKG